MTGYDIRLEVFDPNDFVFNFAAWGLNFDFIAFAFANQATGNGRVDRDFAQFKVGLVVANEEGRALPAVTTAACTSAAPNGAVLRTSATTAGSTSPSNGQPKATEIERIKVAMLFERLSLDPKESSYVFSQPRSRRLRNPDRLRRRERYHQNTSIKGVPFGRRLTKKESPDRHRNRACQRSGKPSLTASPNRRTNHALTAVFDLPTL